MPEANTPQEYDVADILAASDLDKVEQYRFDVFFYLGWPPEIAELMALKRTIDLNEVRGLLRRGCNLATTLRIVW